MDYELFTEDGRRGWIGNWYSHRSDDSMEPLDTPIKADQYIDETRCFISTAYPEGITHRWSLKLKGFLKEATEDELWEFGLISSGRAKVSSQCFFSVIVIADAFLFSSSTLTESW